MTTDPAPLFLLSPGRSGTTLLWRLLRDHPALALTDEWGIFDQAWAMARWAGIDRRQSLRLDLERPVELPGLLAPGAPGELWPALAQGLRAYLLSAYSARFSDRDYLWFGEKLPHPEAAEFALELFGGGRAFCLLRHPLDYVCSARAYAERPEIAAAYPWLRVPLEAHLARWRAFAEGALARLGPAGILRYEDLRRDPQAVVGAVLRSLAVREPAPEVPPGELLELARRHGTRADGGVGRHLGELAPERASELLAGLEPLLERLGYGLAPPEPSLLSVSALRPGAAPISEAPDAHTLAGWQRANRVLAAGTYSVTHGALRYPDGLYPLLASSGRGARLRCSDGRGYVDWIMGFGPVLLGYRHPALERTLQREAHRAPLLSLLQPLEIELAERLRALVPGAEGLAFGKNGSDVLALAVRLARSATGRERVAVCGYHGFHDWYLASLPATRGFPESLRSSVVAFPYGDLGAIEALLRAPPGLAAVVLEPAGFHQPPPGYLQGLANQCRAHGAVLIFDEVVTGLRLAPGGAQEAFGVRADLVCYGKALANGLPLSAVLGPERLLREIVHVGYGLTFRGERASLAAARTALEVQLERDASGHAARIGTQLRRGFAARAALHGLPVELVGLPARLTFSAGPLPGLAPLALQALFLQVCLEHGVLSNGSFLPSLAHGEAELELSFQAFERAFEALALARDRGTMEGLLRIPALSM